MSKSDIEDTTFFHEQMRGVKKVKGSNKIFHPHPNPPPSRGRGNTSNKKNSPFPPCGGRTGWGEENNIFQFSDHLKETVTSATTLAFAQPAMPEKVLRDLRLGKITQTKILDLHGYTVTQARHLLSQFLTIGIEQEQRCVRVIHGKGKLDIKEPVLKNQVNNWLRQHPAVLAFHSAIPRDGGTGAVYVLLKRKKLKEI